MSDEVEKVSITVADTRGSATRILTDEYNVDDTKWPNLVQVFLEQLQGVGYKFEASPVEMVDALEEFSQDVMCAECSGCEDEKPVTEASKQEYPYVGMYTGENGVTIVQFEKPLTGKCIFTYGHRNTTNEYSTNWAEEEFVRL